MGADWSSGLDLFLDLDRRGGLRVGVEHALREAVRDGRLAPGAALPSSRSLARDLSVARGTVSAAYGQLAAEGYLEMRQGAPVRVSRHRARPRAQPVRSPAPDPSVMSAMTIFPDWPLRHRVIIFNDANTAQRQASDLAHELSHGLRMHEPRHAIVAGCRDYSRLEEDEAAWLSGCLLVPREAALQVAMSGTLLQSAAAEYGVSDRMMSWRLNATGARAQAALHAGPECLPDHPAAPER